jgi:hypothetical protein
MLLHDPVVGVFRDIGRGKVIIMLHPLVTFSTFSLLIFTDLLTLA